MFVNKIGTKISIRITAAVFILSLALIQAQADSAGNSKIILKQESSGLFILTISDPEGIREFSLRPKKGSSYGGGVDCPRKFQNNNVVFNIDDFAGDMDAYVIDCQGNTDEFKIGPPENKITKGVLVVAEVVEEKKSVPEQAQVNEAKKKEKAPAPVKGSADDTAARAKKLKSVSYPVAELGNCNDQLECQIFCDSSVNIKACTNFAEKHGLMSKSEVESARKFADVPTGEAPGGCASHDSCMAYCESVEHLDECVNFAEKYGFLSGDELREARIVLKLRQDNIDFQGVCVTKAQCEAYCTEGDHIEECLAFGESSGLIPPAELEMAKKMLPLIKEGKTPGGCKSKEQCEAFCQDAKNMRQCLAFGEEHNIIPKEELEMAKKFLPLLEQGKTPGKCTTKEQCESYCQEEANINECIAFGVEAGFISEADAELARKTGGKGPGGCKSKEQCEAFCKTPENMEVCQAFAHEHGIETNGPGGCRDMEECRAYCTNPEHQNECESFATERGLDVKGPGGCEGKEQCSAYCKGEEHRDECEGFFKEHKIEFNGPGGCKSFEECGAYCKAPEHLEECLSFTGGQGGGLPGGSSGGPGGCQSQIECEEYCEENPDKCGGHGDGPPAGGSGGFGGPGGCRSQEECQDYCQNHPDECKGFGGGGGLPPGPGSGGGSGGGGFSGQSNQCSFLDFDPVCAECTDSNALCAKSSDGGPPALYEDITFNNECIAKLQGAKVKHKGDCPGHKSCPKIFDPVCAEKEGAIQSYYNECLTRDDAKTGKLTILYKGECRSGGGGGGPGRQQQPCPAMPTVDSCPPGQKKEAVFTSPQCGTYYACIPDFSGGQHEAPFSIPIPPSSFPTPVPTPTPFPTQPTPLSPSDPITLCMSKGGVWIEDKVLGSYCHVSNAGQTSTAPPPPPPTPPSSGTFEILPLSTEMCLPFSLVPSCADVGAVDSTAYKLCKQCYPNR